MSQNKRDYQVKEEAPVLEIVEEEVEEIKPEIKEEVEPKVEPIKKAPKVVKTKGKVILITRDGCIVETEKRGNIALNGKEYKELKIGETIEF